jgi:ABC-2 type transport system ATP-binding protein/lipopolysaccharide transport system ATP-binding protein
MALVVDIQHVTKIYRLGAERSNWRALVPGPFGEQPLGEAFHALTDVSLQIEAGEALGIIGANGAGKSTILKILAGVVEPTYGSVEIRGRVAPIIELGVGFDPELNGSENVRFGGALLGHDAQELEERYESIVAFSGLGDFMETPVKRYSTGMRARLGFSLVTAFDADLILLDEVLSVGDFDFQNRSLRRVRELHERGAAVVAVSHSNQMISQLCSNLVLLEHGQIVAEGDPVTVISRYIGDQVIGIGEPFEDDRVYADLVADPPEGAPVAIEDLEVVPEAFEPGGTLTFRFTLRVLEPVDARLVMSIYSIGRAAFAEPEEGPSDLLGQVGTWTISGQIASFPVAPGPYHLRVAVIPEHDPNDFDQEYLESLAKETTPFRILGETTRRPGLMFDTTWEASEADDVEVEVDDAEVVVDAEVQP